LLHVPLTIYTGFLEEYRRIFSFATIVNLLLVNIFFLNLPENGFIMSYGKILKGERGAAALGSEWVILANPGSQAGAWN